MNKIIIGVLPQILLKTDDNPYNDKYEFLDLYCKKIFSCGGIPIGICLNNGKLDKDVLDLCDAFLLPGGNKIWDCYYEVIDYAIRNNKPLLGICLGFQAISIYSMILDMGMSNFTIDNFIKSYEKLKEENGGIVLKQIENNNHRKLKVNYDNVDLARHKVNIIDKSSYLYETIKKSEINPVSLHSFTTIGVGSNFKITAVADDGVIEGIEYNNKDYFILGVCFHPEWDDDNKIFKRLVMEAKKRNGK